MKRTAWAPTSLKRSPTRAAVEEKGAFCGSFSLVTMQLSRVLRPPQYYLWQAADGQLQLSTPADAAAAAAAPPGGGGSARGDSGIRRHRVMTRRQALSAATAYSSSSSEGSSDDGSSDEVFV